MDKIFTFESGNRLKNDADQTDAHRFFYLWYLKKLFFDASNTCHRES